MRKTLFVISFSFLLAVGIYYFGSNFFRGSDSSLQTGYVCCELFCPAPLNSEYMTFEQMEWYLKHLKERYPNVSLRSIGKTYEERDIWLLKVTSNTTQSSKRRAVWIESGLHAREWIGSSTGFHLIEKIVTTYNSSSDVDFFFVPMANPDGYEFSRTTIRRWRKNRAPIANSPCKGVDLNRNWNVKFFTGGTNRKCSELYKGAYPFSEAETMAVKDAIGQVNISHHLEMAIAIHSYGNAILYPWGYSADQVDNYELLDTGAKLFMEAAKMVHGTEFRVGSIHSVLYPVTGTFQDWAKKTLRLKVVYIVELRKGMMYTPFVVAEEFIKPTANEFYEGFNVLMKYFYRY